MRGWVRIGFWKVWYCVNFRFIYNCHQVVVGDARHRDSNAVSAWPGEMKFCSLRQCVAQIRIITLWEVQEVGIMHEFWWISQQCMGTNWIFHWKCPGAVSALVICLSVRPGPVLLLLPTCPKTSMEALSPLKTFPLLKPGQDLVRLHPGYSGSRGIENLVDIFGGLSLYLYSRPGEQEMHR